jgi:hypothetical protein
MAPGKVGRPAIQLLARRHAFELNEVGRDLGVLLDGWQAVIVSRLRRHGQCPASGGLRRFLQYRALYLRRAKQRGP